MKRFHLPLKPTEPIEAVGFVRLVAKLLVLALFVCAAIAMWWQSGGLESSLGESEPIVLRLIAPSMCLLPCILYVFYLVRSRRK